MKTKTIFKTLAFVMMMPAMLLTTACSSDDDAVNNNENTQKKYYEIPVTVTVTRQGEGTRATYDGETKKLSFSTGDKLFVNGHHETAGFFAGALDLLSASDGTFEGTVIAQSLYTGTAEAFLKGADEAFATLLPAGYENYDYLKFTLNDNPVDEITSPYTSVSAIIENSLLPLGKAEAVAQLSHEYAFNYDGYVFALSPQRPVICCTINGLPAETSVPVFYHGKYRDVSGNITTNGSGTATFAFTDFTGADSPLGTLTVNGNAIDLPSNKELEAGHVYNINRSIIPAEPAEGHALSASAVGEIVCSDGLAYAAADKDNLPTGVTAVAIVAYVGDAGSVDASSSTYKGLAIAMTNANDGSGCGWGEYFVSYNCVSKSNDIAIAIGYKDGISSTNTLTSDGHYHEAATAAVSNNGTAAPTGTSGWFLPSMGQWNLIVQGLASKKAGSAVTTNISTSNNSTYAYSNLNSVIIAAGGTGFNGGYQSSTQYDSDWCWHMDISEGRACGYVFYAGDYVRSVLAF